MRVVRVLCCQYVLLRMEADACFCSCEGSGKRNLLAEPTLLKRVMRVTMKSKRSAKRKKKAVPVSAGAGKRKSLEARAKQIAHDAHAVHAWLEPILKASAAAEKAYAFKQRLKEWNHICDKVVAKRAHEDPKFRKPGYQPKSVTDASGFRIVRLFNAEIPNTLSDLFQLFNAPRNPGAGGHFKDRCVREIIFYSSRRKSDPLSILSQVEETVEKYGYKDRFQVEEASSYSSVHLIVESQVGRDGNLVSARSEIQIRSVFEEAWSEINHRLNYARAKSARARGTENLSESDSLREARLHLDVLKSLSDGCAQYADLINIQILRSSPSASPREPLALESSARGIALFAPCSKQLRGVVQKAFDVREKAESLPRGDPNKEAEYLAASRVFMKALDKLKSTSVPNTVQRSDLDSLLKEELAYCYVFSGNTELRNQAEALYRDLLSVSKDNVSALLRLGQLRRDAGDLKEARLLIERGLAVASGTGSTSVTKEALWVLRRDLGFIYWRIVDSDPQAAEALDLLRKAADLTEEATHKTTPHDYYWLNSRSNLLYYLWELWFREEEKNRAKVAQRARELLAELRPLDITDWTVETLDSLLRGEHAFGEKEEARKVAAIIIKALRDKIRTPSTAAGVLNYSQVLQSLPPDDRDMYQFAQSVLADSD